MVPSYKKLLALFVALLISVVAFASADLNSATEKVLKSLPGIGKVTAKAIVAEREANGEFTSLKNLSKRVKGVGNKTVMKLEAAGVTFGADEEAAAKKE
ncbi:MAG: competence protein ComE [Opitutaceae bacterium]|nr:competence protein ComE [Opitutaceae bacterium]